MAHEEMISNFMQYDYKEIKDLATEFLTLITAVLVFSLAFSEKIIEFKKAKKSIRNILVLGWLCFFISIIACGVSLVFNAYAASSMIYAYEKYRAFSISYYAAILLIGAGCTFVIGLAFLIVAGFYGAQTIPQPPNGDA